MHQTDRKYQLFPSSGKQLPACPAGKSLDPEQAFALAMGQGSNNGEKGEKTNPGAGLRIRIKEHNLNRRRKVSVPELGPMTTVQEVAMDSPTIPGRPPLHERSISAPGVNSWKHNHLAEFMAISRDQAPDERAELRTSSPKRCQNELPRQPLSPKSLAPLVIPAPSSAVPRLSHQVSLNRLRSGSTPAEPALLSAKTDESPRIRTPFTPLSAALTPKSAATSTMTTSTLPTPVTAPIEARFSPKPWERPTNYAVLSTPKEGIATPSAAPKNDLPEPPQSAPLALGHRRNQSDTGSIMERGRPRKRTDILKRSGSKRSKSSERRAFEQLPKGWKATEAANMLSQQEVAALSKQALQQAARFEVLRKDDVDSLSRELRQLDERTEYLRRTYTSLRAGRRNLHTRICQYLRSPRTAKFSHDAILKQEEALAELDASIDDWVAKLEQAENRRTRVRQKLLEHVAAAATLSLAPVHGVSESLQFAMGVRPLNAGNISTPPRSPTKHSFSSHTPSSSPSPHRVVAQVPSTILEQPLFEEASTIGAAPSKEEDAAASVRRAETIRIYAANDVYALLADVEQAISKMSAGAELSPAKEESLSETEKKDLHRQHSHERLNGSPTKVATTTLPTLTTDEKSGSSSVLPLATAATPPPPAAPAATEEIFLTSAVFKPERSFTN
ncbi:Up-regulated during septation-domain-containing protein [Cercophora newfieldiana]|uniref:Up-regulated during septation-domain-containing protein n=1 Tax=Cercophora newfieldiana TaxID=92897 RepID=A0AA39YGN1_9PEZI|nr:Up-regulated during septation-domain-containing protein [Cercophora newfieldiana]